MKELDGATEKNYIQLKLIYTRKKQGEQKNNHYLSKEQAKTLTQCYAYSSFL